MFQTRMVLWKKFLIISGVFASGFFSWSPKDKKFEISPAGANFECREILVTINHYSNVERSYALEKPDPTTGLSKTYSSRLNHWTSDSGRLCELDLHLGKETTEGSRLNPVMPHRAALAHLNVWMEEHKRDGYICEFETIPLDSAWPYAEMLTCTKSVEWQDFPTQGCQGVRQMQHSYQFSQIYGSGGNGYVNPYKSVSTKYYFAYQSFRDEYSNHCPCLKCAELEKAPLY